ncbi:hypothetical protein JTB14_020659 [Gonioctena quinquepunctata]|nr:hypothetical protein JTB14_020659 [Gonioctena quinquepunctata]
MSILKYFCAYQSKFRLLYNQIFIAKLNRRKTEEGGSFDINEAITFRSTLCITVSSNISTKMFKLIVVLAITSAVFADPKASVLHAAPLAVAPAYVTAHSSQVVARNYNALVAPAAPLVAAAPVAALRSPLVAAAPFAAPFAGSYRVAAPALAAPYLASPYVAAPWL